MTESMFYGIDTEKVNISKVPHGLFCKNFLHTCPYMEETELWCAYTKNLIIFERKSGKPIKDMYGCPFVDNKDKRRIKWEGAPYKCDDTEGFRRVFGKWRQSHPKLVEWADDIISAFASTEPDK